MEEKRLFKAVKRKANALIIRGKNEAEIAASILKDTNGDQVISSGGLAIIAVIAAAAVIAWIVIFQPKFFSKLGDTIMDMFEK